ncbi:MAG: radical SAM protein [Deltaproteobacteria bacterium]|nr:radical SAM protein [Deltaproteobacteria bacterium]
MLTYREGPGSDPFFRIYGSDGWLRSYDPPRPFPFFVNLEPTNACQLDCLFCSRQLSKRPIGYLDLGLARELFDECARHEGAAVRFTGWGEPLMHPRILGLAGLAKERSIGLKLYTNGLLLTEAMMGAFVEMGLDDLQFSLQGLNEPQYLFNRRKGDYALLSRNIRMASIVRGSAKRPFLSLLTSVLENELAEGDPKAFTESWLPYVDKVAIDLTNLNFVSGSPRVAPYLANQSKGLSRGKCVDVFLALEVKYDGRIQFCGQDADGRECHTIGVFGETGLQEAWLSDRMGAQRDLVGRNLGHSASEVCRNCYHNTSKYELFKRKEAGLGPAGGA